MALSTNSAGTYSLSASYQFLDAKDVEVLEAIDAGTAGTINEQLTREAYGGLWNRSANSGTLRIQFDNTDRTWSANIRAQFVGKYGDESLDKNGIVMSQPPRKVLDRPDEYVAGYIVWNTALMRKFEIGMIKDLTVTVGINNIADVLNPVLIPALVGRQYFVQTTINLY
jgi:outer membrane receptor for Fe3+-dicitrate